VIELRNSDVVMDRISYESNFNIVRKNLINTSPAYFQKSWKAKVYLK